MDADVEIQRIIEALILFFQGSHRNVPRELNLILENIDYIQNQAISIFFAKAIRHIESSALELNIADNTRTSLPPSLYYGIIHPSSHIRRFCRNAVSEKHPKNSFTDLGDYTNIIQPIIQSIIQNLSFMEYTDDTQCFDHTEQDTAVPDGQSAIQSFMANAQSTVEYAETHLYSGLKLLVEKLSDDILNDHFLSTPHSDLWNVLFAPITNNEHKNVVSHCCNIMRRVLQCSHHYLLWEHRNLLIPDINAFIRKMCRLLMTSFEIEPKKFKEIILCLDAAVQSKVYISDNREDMRLIHDVMECLLTQCWTKHKASPVGIVGYHILNSAFRIIGCFLYDTDESKQHILHSLLARWSKLCVGFTIAGNIKDEDDDARQRLSMYAGIGYNNIITLQSNRVTGLVSQILMMDTKNVMDILQTYLFTTRYSRQNKVEIVSYHPLNDRIKNEDTLYQNNRLWMELLASDIDPWNYPASIHKLMFEMYRDMAAWDHLQCYTFRNQSNEMMRAYYAVYSGWMTRIQRYFDILTQNCELALAVGALSGPSVMQCLIASYILSGNEAIKCKMDDIIHTAFNVKEEESECAVINASLKGQNLKLILRHCIMNRKDFLRCFTNDDNEKNKPKQIEAYNQFVQSIVEGVLKAIELFENRLPIMEEIPTLFADNPRFALQYFFAVKEHIVSMIANTLSFIDYFRSNNIKWDAAPNDNNNHNTNDTKRYLCFSEIIFSYSEAFRVIIDYVLRNKDGIFGCAAGEFIRNKYFDDHQGRMQDMVHILSFLSNHWAKYIEPLFADSPNDSFDYEHYLFDWFQILKYPQIGKEWIHLITLITENNPSIGDLFVAYVKNEMNECDMTQILNQYFDIHQIKTHQNGCENAKCSAYHLVHREQLTDLLGDADGPTAVQHQATKTTMI